MRYWILFVLSISLLIYMLVPGPLSINDIPALNSALKSDEPGDTYQVPNIAAYFSYHDRNQITSFYRTSFQALTWLPFRPLRLNYPPESAFTYVKDQTKATFLEEMVYPLRDSLFVSGFEPYYPDGSPKYSGATNIEIHNMIFNSKTTLRYYPSNIWVRIAVWIGINICGYLLYRQFRLVIFNKL